MLIIYSVNLIDILSLHSLYVRSFKGLILLILIIHPLNNTRYNSQSYSKMKILFKE